MKTGSFKKSDTNCLDWLRAILDDLTSNKFPSCGSHKCELMSTFYCTFSRRLRCSHPPLVQKKKNKKKVKNNIHVTLCLTIDSHSISYEFSSGPDCVTWVICLLLWSSPCLSYPPSPCSCCSPFPLDLFVDIILFLLPLAAWKKSSSSWRWTPLRLSFSL